MVPYIVSAIIVVPLSILWFGMDDLFLALFVAFLSVFALPKKAPSNKAVERPPIGQGLAIVARSLGIFISFVALMFLGRFLWSLVSG